METVSSLRENQLALMNQGSGLKLGQQQLRADIAHNLRQLIQEKTVIQTTHSQLRNLAMALTDQLGKVVCTLCSLILSHISTKIHVFLNPKFFNICFTFLVHSDTTRHVPWFCAELSEIVSVNVVFILHCRYTKSIYQYNFLHISMVSLNFLKLPEVSQVLSHL